MVITFISFSSNSAIDKIDLSNIHFYSMYPPSVEIISDCFIKPKFISESKSESRKPVYFSPWDLAIMSLNYIQKGLLFSLPKTQHFSIHTFLHDLKDSLSITLSHFHPLAARLTTQKHENPPSFVVFIDQENSPGARFIHSVVNLTVSDILTPTDVPLVFQSFFDHHKAINHDGHEFSLLSVQVTELIDGIFIGCSVNHMVADGTSYWHFFNSWSEVFKSKAKNDDIVPISRPPVLERWIPEGCDPIIALPFTHEDQYIDRYNPPLLRERIFHFSVESLARLKEKVNSECNTVNISTLQSLSALVWRCVTRARGIPGDQETVCTMAINNRSRLSPPLSQHYFGNSVQTVKGTATACELLDKGIGLGALRLKEAVSHHDDKTIRESVGLWVKSPFVYTISKFINSNIVHIGSSPRFDMYGPEFGLGKALAVRSGYANKLDGKMTLYAGREGGGSMDLEVCLIPETMKALETDEEFMSVANGEK